MVCRTVLHRLHTTITCHRGSSQGWGEGATALWSPVLPQGIQPRVRSEETYYAFLPSPLGEVTHAFWRGELSCAGLPFGGRIYYIFRDTTRAEVPLPYLVA